MGDRIVTHDHSDHSLVTLLLPITDLIFSFSHSSLPALMQILTLIIYNCNEDCTAGSTYTCSSLLVS